MRQQLECDRWRITGRSRITVSWDSEQWELDSATLGEHFEVAPLLSSILFRYLISIVFGFPKTSVSGESSNL